MSSKKGSYKVMPILCIVFFSIALALIFAKGVWATAYRLVLYGTDIFTHSLLAEAGKAFALGFPAVFFIICSAAYLKKSPTFKKWRIIAVTAQSISCVLLIARLVYANALYTFPKARTYAYIVSFLFAVTGILCFIAAVKIIKDKNARMLLLVAAVFGILAGLCLSGVEIFQLIKGFYYYSEHIFLIINKCIASLLYFVSFTFYYTALIFFALFKTKAFKDNDKVKVVLKK